MISPHRHYASEDEASRSKSAVQHGWVPEECVHGQWMLAAPKAPRAPLARKAGLPRSRRERTVASRQTGFPRPVKLAVRTRAGNGDIGAASCESCGAWLGRYGGQVQHIVARGMGGTSDPVLSTAVNAALLCGTPVDKSTCHGLAESRDREMGARGFWLPQGSDPRLEPMMLHSPHGSGVLVWRSEDGRYLADGPERSAA